MKKFLLLMILLMQFVSAQTAFKNPALIIGKDTDIDMDYRVDRAGSDSPTLRWDASDEKWRLSHDGLTFEEMTSKEYVDDADTDLDADITANDAAAVHKAGSETISGDKTVTGKLIASSTSHGNIPCPAMSGTQRDAIASPANGDCIYNTTTSSLNIYSTASSSWKAAGGGISDWVTSFAYTTGDVIIQSNKIYQAASSHTSGTFATDLSGGKWTQLYSDYATTTSVALKANIASPALTGSPTAPTQASLDNSTKIATTAYVEGAVGNANATAVHLAGTETITGQKIFANKFTSTSTTLANMPCPYVTTSQMNAISFHTTGDCVFNSDTQTNYRWDSVAGAWKENADQSPKNYIGNNFDAEDTATDGWNCYADAAGVAPVDGTGGSPNTTITNVASTNLSDKRLFRVTKSSGASRQGEGCSYAFTIDSSYKAKPLRVSFPYITSANISDGDYRVYVYDVTNSRLIELTDNRDINANSFGHFIGTFQASSDSTSYRLIVHTATTSTTAATLDYDDVTVGPQTLSRGAPVIDAKTYTPTFTGIACDNIDFKYSQVGKWYHIKGSAQVVGVNGTAVTISLPGGANIDVSELSRFGSSARYLLDGKLHTTNNAGGSGLYSSSGGMVLHALSSNTTGILLAINNTTDASGEVLSGEITGSAAFNVGANFTFTAAVPIVGKSSSMALSEDGGTRVIALNAQTAIPVSIPNNTQTAIVFNLINGDATSGDTAGALNTSTGAYTIPESGWYAASAFVNFAGNATGYRDVQIVANSTTSHGLTRMPSLGASPDTWVTAGTSASYFTKGTTLVVLARQTSGGSLNCNAAYFSLAKISSPQTIAGGATVSATYSTDAAQAVASGSLVNIVYEDLVATSHPGSMNTSTGVFTIPESGMYYAKCAIGLAPSTGWTVAEYANPRLYVNGVSKAEMVTSAIATTTSSVYFGHPPVTFTGRMSKGDTVNCAMVQNSGVSISLDASGAENQFTITKVGNP